MQVMPYSTGLSTPLANFEANQNYKDTVDPSVMVRLIWTKSLTLLPLLSLPPSPLAPGGLCQACMHVPAAVGVP